MNIVQLLSLISESNELVAAMNHLVTSALETNAWNYVEYEDYYCRYNTIQKEIKELLNPPPVGYRHSEQMKASEARQLVKKASQDLEANDHAQYDEIMGKIQAEIKKTLSFEMWYYKTISKPLLKKLEDDGYMVSNHSDQREGTMYKISWQDTSTTEYYNK